MDSDRLLMIIDGHDALACTIDPGDLEQRLDDWRAITKLAVDHVDVEGGRRFRFPRNVDIEAIARLAAAEQTCCSFFEFTIGVTGSTVTLDIIGPPEAAELIGAFAHSE